MALMEVQPDRREVHERAIEVKNKQFSGVAGDGPIFANHPFSVYPGKHLRI